MTTNATCHTCPLRAGWQRHRDRRAPGQSDRPAMVRQAEPQIRHGLPGVVGWTRRLSCRRGGSRGFEGRGAAIMHARHRPWIEERLMFEEIVAAFERGEVIPYLGPGVLSLARSSELPASPEALVSYLTKTATVPHKIRNNLTAAAQYIENFKHRKTVVAAMNNAFSAPTATDRAARMARRAAQIAAAGQRLVR